MTTTSTPTAGPDRIRRTIWVALLMVVFYVFCAAVLGNLFGELAGDDDTAEFVLSHFIPLPIAIVLGLLFVRWARWDGIWSETPTVSMRPRRLWLILIPVLATIIPIGNAFDVDWPSQSVSTVLLVAGGVLMVGFGEELYLRGILLTAVRARHGELVTLLVTSIVFALAHVLSSIWADVPFGRIVFQVFGLTMAGIAYYWLRRVTGRLWVGVLVHAFTDGVLYLGSDISRPSEALTHHATSSNETFLIVVQVVLIVLSVISIVSVVREDRRHRAGARTPASEAVTER